MPMSDLARKAARRALGRRLLGLAFVLLLVAFLGVAVGAYRKVFTPVAMVGLRADHTGNQLSPGADVTLHGVIVGSVRGVRATGDAAQVQLALRPGALDTIPRNVQARLLPRTLFGQRYVSLVLPGPPAAGHLRSGDTVQQDRSAPAIEVDRVLSDLMPLLRAVPPEKLNATLHALSTALAGRGDRLGRNLVMLQRYVGRLNPKLPALVHDLQALSGAADTLNSAAPDLLAAMDNLRTTNVTIVTQRALLADLLRSTTGLADTAEPFLAANAGRLIRLSAQSRPVLGALAEYAPEYPCFFQGMAGLIPRAEQAFGRGQPGLRIVLSVVRDNGKYQQGEQPRNGLDLGPQCHGLPGNVPVPLGEPDMGGRDSSGHLPDGSGSSGTGTLGRAVTADIGVPGSPAETAAVRALLAPVEGIPPDRVSGTDALLYAPMLRGTEVTYR
jgi:phospholipid/cholesterol/gamma-HCH transport system substrate-binding protein